LRRSARLAALVAISLGLSPLVPTTRAVADQERVRGVDVSHYQGGIRWPRVARAGVRFAVIKATEGASLVDHRYRANRERSVANDIVPGAYHFARPSRRPRSAIRQANHYLRVAHLRSGQLVPVLDLEVDGGLPRYRLRAWVRRWVQRVRAVTNLRAVIYTSARFWHHAMGNTTWFAHRGYRLWLAQWHVRAPSVPAHRWTGSGWSLWQWTACRHVRGIHGCVDGNRASGPSLDGLRIPRLRVTVSHGGSVASAPQGLRCAAGHACDASFDPGSDVMLRARPQPGAAFLGWDGPCEATLTPGVCRVDALGERRVRALFLTIPAGPVSPARRVDRPARMTPGTGLP
jgi:GH25 family lysozyme M1 (1,4-beta-N-acetylmuramidase)